MRIYLLRHAEVLSNKNGSLSVEHDEQLTTDGKQQALAIVNQLLGLGIKRVLSSPLPRAIETALPFSRQSGIDIEELPELSEGHLMLKNDLPFSSPSFFVHNQYGRLPASNESDEQFYTRASLALNIIKNSSLESVLIVTHGHMIRELINQILKLPIRARFPHKNCHATAINIGDYASVIFMNKDLTCV